MSQCPDRIRCGLPCTRLLRTIGMTTSAIAVASPTGSLARNCLDGLTAPLHPEFEKPYLNTTSHACRYRSLSRCYLGPTSCLLLQSIYVRGPTSLIPVIPSELMAASDAAPCSNTPARARNQQVPCGLHDGGACRDGLPQIATLPAALPGAASSTHALG
jgi:hypothetical protein